jgi:hypothetical protein
MASFTVRRTTVLFRLTFAELEETTDDCDDCDCDDLKEYTPIEGQDTVLLEFEKAASADTFFLNGRTYKRTDLGAILSAHLLLNEAWENWRMSESVRLDVKSADGYYYWANGRQTDCKPCVRYIQERVELFLDSTL